MRCHKHNNGGHQTQLVRILTSLRRQAMSSTAVVWIHTRSMHCRSFGDRKNYGSPTKAACLLNCRIARSVVIYSSLNAALASSRYLQSDTIRRGLRSAEIEQNFIEILSKSVYWPRMRCMVFGGCDLPTVVVDERQLWHARCSSPDYLREITRNNAARDSGEIA